MEKLPRIELESLWHDLPGRQRYEIVKQLAGIEKRIASAKFTSYGSLYYVRHFPKVDSNQKVCDVEDGVALQCSRFAVGPTTFFGDGRGSVDVDRGPYPDKPTQITGIIDWQSIHISLFFLQAPVPALIEFDGPIAQGLGQLPPNFDKMTADEWRCCGLHSRSTSSTVSSYAVDTRTSFALSQHRETLPCKIPALSGSFFSDGDPMAEGMLMAVQRGWKKIVGEGLDGGPAVPCPLAFSKGDEENLRRS
ncbi:MAG: hypothetical protein Q9173_005188 [Seirophora scorigena]